MSDEAKQFWLAMVAILIVAVAYETYKPVGISLAVIALVTMVLRG